MISVMKRTASFKQKNLTTNPTVTTKKKRKVRSKLDTGLGNNRRLKKRVSRKVSKNVNKNSVVQDQKTTSKKNGIQSKYSRQAQRNRRRPNSRIKEEKTDKKIQQIQDRLTTSKFQKKELCQRCRRRTVKSELFCNKSCGHSICVKCLKKIKKTSSYKMTVYCSAAGCPKKYDSRKLEYFLKNPESYNQKQQQKQNNNEEEHRKQLQNFNEQLTFSPRQQIQQQHEQSDEECKEDYTYGQKYEEEIKEQKTVSQMDTEEKPVKNDKNITTDKDKDDSDSDSSVFIANQSTDGASGLQNPLTYCYLNSVVQCLFHTPEFSDCFENNRFKRQLKRDHKEIAEQFSLLLKDNIKRDESLSVANLKEKVAEIYDQFSSWQMQDAHEFLNTLRQGINNDMNRSIKRKIQPPRISERLSIQKQSDLWKRHNQQIDDSIVQDLFAGQFLNLIKCNKCKGESYAFDNFLDMQLSFEKKQNKTQTNFFSLLSNNDNKQLEDVEKMIANFLSEEYLDGDYRCSKCKNKGGCTKRLIIQKFPKILVLQLKRFVFKFDAFGMTSEKIESHVKFPAELDLTEFAKESQDQTANNPKYQLYGVVNHWGNLDGGHYTCQIKSKRDQKWYTVDDNQVTLEEDKAYDNGVVNSDEPYLLFYKRIQ